MITTGPHGDEVMRIAAGKLALTVVLSAGLIACDSSERDTNSGSNNGGGSGGVGRVTDTGAPDAAPAIDSGAQAQDTGVVGSPDAAANPDAEAPAADAGFPMDAMAMGPVCPPTGPTGNLVNDVVNDVTLTDCDGRTYTLHDLCSKKAAWMYGFAYW